MPLTTKEILSAAIKLEEDGIKFYTEIATKTANQLTKKMFESLAADETKHIEWIKGLSPDVSSSGEFNRKLYSRLKGIFANAPESMKKEATSTKDDMKAIEIAIDMEVKSKQEYQRFADESRDKAFKNLFTILADIERFHADVLRNSREYLDAPYDWFMQEEGWMFDGG